MKSIDEMVKSVKAIMVIESMEMTSFAEELGRKMLKGQITLEEAIKIIKEKYNLEVNHGK